MSEIRIGDIVEIETPKGNAFLHCILLESINCELVRVLTGLYQERPTDLESIARQEEQFMIFFPLKAAVRLKIVEKVGHVSAAGFSLPKYMREIHIVRGAFLGWHIIDTETTKRQLVENLTSEQRKLSSWSIWNDTLLRDRLAAGWSLENWGSRWEKQSGSGFQTV